ncbi:hypothetical protein FRB99_002503 [Tulasnella sp. 403]|nr:hypothetical protein FRB99_002503 [Tulasnella sp. 403]
MRSSLSFTEDSRIGSGRLGVVLRANLVVETTGINSVVATKRLFQPKDPEATDTFLSMVQEKANRWSALLHPNVLSITGYSMTEQEAAVEVLSVFPYMPTGTITDYIKQRSPGYSQRIKLATDVAQGLFYLHSRTPPIRHGNLHPRNLLMNVNGDAVLCDYDIDELANQMEEHAAADSFRYLSPEHLNNNTMLSLRSDIITDQAPYQGIIDKATLVNAIGQRIMPAEIDKLDCPPRAQNVLGLCWKWEPESRASLSEIISIMSGKLCRFAEAWSIPTKGVDCLSFSYDGKFLAVGFSKFGFRVYDAETGALAYELPMPSPGYIRVQISHSGRFLVASDNNKVSLWDLETRKLKETFQGHQKGTNGIWALDISPDDAYVISGAHDKTIRMWRPALQTDNSKLLKETGRYDTTRLVISPDAAVAAVSIHGHQNELFDVNTGQTIAVLQRPNDCWALRFSPDGKRVYGGCDSGLVCYWDVGDLLPMEDKASKVPSRPYHAIKGARLPQDAVDVVSVSNSWLVSISIDGDVRAMKLEPATTSTESIGKVSAFRDTNRVDLSPVSDDGVGLAVSCPQSSELLTVHRYMSWDTPGVYMY